MADEKSSALLVEKKYHEAFFLSKKQTGHTALSLA
jgi:hypothetical protein